MAVVVENCILGLFIFLSVCRSARPSARLPMCLFVIIAVSEVSCNTGNEHEIKAAIKISPQVQFLLRGGEQKLLFYLNLVHCLQFAHTHT